MRRDIRTATLDTNVFPADQLVSLASRSGIAAAVVSVSHREVEGSTLEEEVRSLETILETGVFGESRFGQAVWGTSADAEWLESALAIISNQSFPPRTSRQSLTDGQRRQLRDAMILCAHVRSRRDVLVSNDRRAFVDNGRREAIASTFHTSVMTAAEFEDYLSGLERETAV